MKISDIREEFLSNRISKSNFIKKMYAEKHIHLFDYCSHLNITNIKSIEILDGKVLATSRDRGVLIEITEGDLRNHPLEILNFLDVERKELEMMEQLLTDGDCLYDIGANIGWHSINLALSNRSVNVFSYEPAPKTFACLLNNIQLNNIKNISPFNYGLSNKSGFETFYYKNATTGNSSLRNLNRDEESEVIQCQFIKFDDLLTSNNFKVDFIKCDVEGAELMVFQGAEEVLKKFKPIIFAEILRKFSKEFQYDPNSIFELLKRHNYLAFTLNSHVLEKFEIMDDRTSDTNFFFLHKEKHKHFISRFSNFTQS